MIRPATHDDLAGLVAFCLECHEVMPWAGIGLHPDQDSIISTLLDLLESPVASLSVVDLGHGISGACAVSLGIFPWARSLPVAMEWIWHMRPSFPDGLTKRRWVVRMLDNMMAWAREKNAQAFKISTIHTDKSLVALLKRRGIAPLETACAGRLIYGC